MCKPNSSNSDERKKTQTQGSTFHKYPKTGMDKLQPKSRTRFPGSLNTTHEESHLTANDVVNLGIMYRSLTLGNMHVKISVPCGSRLCQDFDLQLKSEEVWPPLPMLFVYYTVSMFSVSQLKAD